MYQEETGYDHTIFGGFCLSYDGRGSGGRYLAQDKNVERLPRSAWQLTLSLNAPNLVPPAVQWAVLDKDPVPAFRDRIKMMQGFIETRPGPTENEAQKELKRSAQMTVAWDTGFREVTGDQLYLLTGTPGDSHGFASNRSAGIKWIVTKIVRIKGKPVCWCLPVEVKPGEPIKVTLTEDNVFDLEAVFNDASGVEKKMEDKAEGAKETSLIKALEKALQGSVVISPQDEPEAHALYNQMIGAMRKANSLSYVIEGVLEFTMHP